MSVLRDLRRLRALCPAERRLLARALLLFPAYVIGVRFARLSAMRRSFNGLRPIEGARADQAARIVGALARRAAWARGCLPAALTLQRLLAAQGVPAEIRLGVRRVGGRMEAHAWVESAGNKVLDTADIGERFEALEAAAAPRP